MVRRWLPAFCVDWPTLLHIALATLIALIIVMLSGGRFSFWYPLLYLPIIIAIVRCDIEVVLTVGFILFAFILFGLPTLITSEPFSLRFENEIRAFGLLLSALIGGLYAARTRHEMQRTRREVTEMTSLLDISQMLNAAPDLESALNLSLMMLTSLIPCSIVAVYLFDGYHRSLLLQAVIGNNGNWLRIEKPQIDPRNMSKVLESAAPLVVAADDRARNDGFHILEQSSKWVVYMPLRSVEAAFGFIYVGTDRSQTFSSNQIKLIGALADRIGFPLFKIRIQENLQGIAFTDELTGLHNYRYFRQVLSDEIHRAERYQHPLALVILDIDDFKLINDQFGHPAGDGVLIQIASIIRANVRTVDITARYGGEEFVVICSETTKEEAIVLAERIRKAIESADYSVESQVAHLTVCAGISVYPGDSDSVNGLLREADTCLYRAKQAGKNRVEATEPTHTSS